MRAKKGDGLHFKDQVRDAQPQPSSNNNNNNNNLDNISLAGNLEFGGSVDLSADGTILIIGSSINCMFQSVRFGTIDQSTTGFVWDRK